MTDSITPKIINIEDIKFDEFVINATHFLKQVIIETFKNNNIFINSISDEAALKIAICVSALSSQGIPSEIAYKIVISAYVLSLSDNSLKVITGNIH